MSAAVPVHRRAAKRRALRILDDWIEVTGVVEPDSSYRYEMEAIVEDAVESGVRVNGPKGVPRLARLVVARESGCLISWQTGRKTGGYGKDGKSQPYEPMVEVPLSSVEPARALGESEARRR